MSNFLVTGGAGFIGSNICRRLIIDGHYVRVIDNFLTGKKSNIEDIIDRIEFIEADMGDEKIAFTAMNDIDVVLHQGALPSVPLSVDDPAATHKHCADATLTLLIAARDAGVKRFVYAASSSAYGDSPTMPKVETMPVNPLSPYAIAKLVGEYYCKVFYELYNIETVSLRYFNVFGPYQNPASQYAAAIPAFVMSMLNDKPPVIYGDGQQSRDFTYVENVVEANLRVALTRRLTGEVMNVACGEAVTVNQVIAMINDILGKDIKPIYVEARQGDVKHSLADITRALDIVGYSPIVGFHEGLKKTIDWYKDTLDAAEGTA